MVKTEGNAGKIRRFLGAKPGIANSVSWLVKDVNFFGVQVIQRVVKTLRRIKILNVEKRLGSAD